MTYSIGFDIFAKDRAGPVISKVGDEFNKAENKLNKFKTAAVAGGAVASAAIIGFGLKSVNIFKDVGGQTLALQRTMGGTAQEASRLRFAATQSGVSFEAFSKSTGKLEKALGATLGNGKATAAMAKTLGFNFQDAHGHILPMAQLLPKVADRFAKMPAGAEKTALAMKLFGKAGAEMLPFLNKGSAGIADLERQSDKYGLTLSGKMLASIKASKAGQRDFNATMQGLQVQIGAQVLPIMTRFVSMIRDQVIPIVMKGTSFLQSHGSAVKFAAVTVLGLVGAMKLFTLTTKVVGAATKIWTGVQLASGAVMKLLRGEQLALNAAMKANMIGLIVVGVMALAVGLIYAYKHCKTFRDVVKDAFRVAAGAVDFVRTHWKLLIDLIMGPFGLAIVAIVTHFDAIKSAAFTSVSFIVRIFLDMVGSLVHGAAEAFGWVPGMGGKLKNAARAFDSFKNDVNRSLSQTQNSLTINANTMPAYKAIQGLLRYAGTAGAYVQVGARAANGAFTGGRQGFAAGTSYAPPGRHWVGEHGPELMDFRGGERITPHRESVQSQRISDADSERPLLVQFMLDGSVLHQSLLKIKRRKGGLELGLA